MATAALELALSASARTPTLALRRDGALVRAGTASSASGLTAAVDEAFRELGATPADLTAIYLDLGPGSYTGLRVAVTFARMVQHFAAVPVLAANSLQLLAAAALRSGSSGDAPMIRPVLDARRERFHHGRIQASDLTVVEPPRAEPCDTLLASIRPDDVVLAAEPLHALLRPAVEAVGARLEDSPSYGATDLFDSRLTLQPKQSSELEPLYLMGSYAEQPR